MTVNECYKFQLEFNRESDIKMVRVIPPEWTHWPIITCFQTWCSRKSRAPCMIHAHPQRWTLTYQVSRWSHCIKKMSGQNKLCGIRKKALVKYRILHILRLLLNSNSTAKNIEEGEGLKSLSGKCNVQTWLGICVKLNWFFNRPTCHNMIKCDRRLETSWCKVAVANLSSCNEGVVGMVLESP